MIFWGSKSETRTVLSPEKKVCSTCGIERDFITLLQYKAHHLQYLLTWITAKQYALVCDVCKNGEKLDSKTVEAKLGKNPIPASKRLGFLLIFLIVPALLGWVAYDSQKRYEKVHLYVSAPKPGDLYVMNMARLVKEPESQFMYGVLRVKEIGGGGINLELPYAYYNMPSGPENDIKSGKARDSKYYDSATIYVSSKELLDFADAGVVSAIER